MAFVELNFYVVMKKNFLLLLSLLFLTLAPLSAQRVNENYPFLSYWDFKFRDAPDSVDCRYNPKNNELFLSGFDTDGKGTFYFAGGNPLRVSCFKGTSLQWRRKVSDTHTKRALFRLRGDSLYLVHDQTHELIILSKDGTGYVRRVKLATDDIDEGVMHQNYIVLRDSGVMDKRVKCIYNWETRQFKVSFFNYQGELAWTDEMTREYCIKMMRPAPDFSMPDEDMKEITYYKGIFRDMHLFVRAGSGEFLLSSFGKILYSCIVPNGGVNFSVLPLQTLNDEIDIESHHPSPEGEILRGTHFYYVGFERANNHLMVVDFDLDKMFPEAADWIKKMMN